jgi:hypothetical protein
MSYYPIKRNLGVVFDPALPNCINVNTGMPVACDQVNASDPWSGWQILIAMAIAGLSTYQQTQFYQNQGYQFQPLNESQYNTAYNALRTSRPDLTQDQINQFLGRGSAGQIPTWVWIALAAAGVLVLLPIIMKRGEK